MTTGGKQCCGECAHARRAVDKNIPLHATSARAPLECVPVIPWWWNPGNVWKAWVEPTDGARCAAFKRKEPSDDQSA
jgi:hypothetical protein